MLILLCLLTVVHAHSFGPRNWLINIRLCVDLTSVVDYQNGISREMLSMRDYTKSMHANKEQTKNPILREIEHSVKSKENLMKQFRRNIQSKVNRRLLLGTTKSNPFSWTNLLSLFFQNNAQINGIHVTSGRLPLKDKWRGEQRVCEFKELRSCK